MLTLRKVAIAGGMTIVCHFFQKHGSFIVYADQIVHELLQYDSVIQQSIVSLFGSEILKN